MTLVKNLYLVFFLSFLFFELSAFSYPLISSSNYLYHPPSLTEKSNDFIRNNPIIKSYGPLLLDLNNMNYDSGIVFIPVLNIDFKPLFLAVNCKESLFNIKDNSNWRQWFKPFFTYELNILNDLCSN